MSKRIVEFWAKKNLYFWSFFVGTVVPTVLVYVSGEKL